MTCCISSSLILTTDNHQLVLRFDDRPAEHHTGQYNPPQQREHAALIVGESGDPRDIIIRRRSGMLQRICEMHPLYDALQYPLLFWKGQNTYDWNLTEVDPVTGIELPAKKLSTMSYYSYLLVVRDSDSNLILRSRDLLNQFVVDMCAKIEAERLRYIQTHQRELRASEYVHLRDAVENDVSAQDLGYVILPSSFIGGQRHMYEYQQDALTYVRHYGRPSLFITFTCNPKWVEIQRELFSGQTAKDRHDIVARVFKMKVDIIVSLLTKHYIFGEALVHLYSIEWQKRGLPHVHILLWLRETIRPEQIDEIISAEIPDVRTDP